MATPSAKTADVKAATQADENADMVYLGGKKVRSRFKWRPSSNGPEFTKESTFDFSGCTEEQVLFLAMYGAKVKVQAILRNLANANPSGKVDPRLYDNVNVLQDIVNAVSAKADPVASAIAALRRAGADETLIKQTADALAKAKK